MHHFEEPNLCLLNSSYLWPLLRSLRHSILDQCILVSGYEHRRHWSVLVLRVHLPNCTNHWSHCRRHHLQLSWWIQLAESVWLMRSPRFLRGNFSSSYTFPWVEDVRLYIPLVRLLLRGQHLAYHDWNHAQLSRCWKENNCELSGDAFVQPIGLLAITVHLWVLLWYHSGKPGQISQSSTRCHPLLVDRCGNIHGHCNGL